MLAMVLTLSLVVATLAMIGVGTVLLERSSRRLGALQPLVWSDLANQVRHDADLLARAIDRSSPSGFDGP